MKIGIISEGHSDRAIITNVIIGITGLDKNDIKAIRPIYKLDATDMAANAHLTESTWSLVKKECEERDLIDGFLAIEGQEFIVIHIDTAEADLYDVKRPQKSADTNYCELLRIEVVNKINEWFGNDNLDKILYAVAIEETDAWILTIYEKNDTSDAVKAKEKLQHLLGKKDIVSTVDYDNYFKLSKPLSKAKDLKKNKYLNYNCSLRLFYEEVTKKVGIVESMETH